MASLHWADWVIFVAFLTLSLGIGVFHACTGGKQKTTQEFIMANRKLQVIPTMLSLLVSYQSAIMVLGITAEIYTRGIQQWIFQCVFMSLAILLAERFLVPWIYGLKVTSVFEYFDMRFRSKIVRVYGAFLGIMSGILYMGVAMFAPSVALESATGFPKEASIPIMAILCVAYTSLGGMRAVIWTDVFQYLIMMGGIIAILIKSSLVTGGFGSAMETMGRENRLNWIDLSPDPTVRHTIWGFLIGWTCNWTFVYGLHQASIQRYNGTGSLRDARLTVLLNIPAIVLMASFAFVSGIFIFAYYADVIRCDPLENGDIRSPNEILPHFVKSVFYEAKGFNGLFLATLYSGALSSVSSSLSGAAANTWVDILKLLPKLKKLPEDKATIVNRTLVIVYGLMATGFAFMSAIIPGPITQVSLALMGSVTGPLFGMFLLGGLFRFMEWKGVLSGGLASLAFNIWLGIGAIRVKGQHPILHPAPVDQCVPPFNVTYNPAIQFSGVQRFYTLSYLWYVPFSVAITMIVGIIVSLIATGCSKAGDADMTEESKCSRDKLFINWRSLFTFGEEDGDEETIASDKSANEERKSQVSRANPAFDEI